MTLIANQTVTSVPNVLSDQTIPNTLGGVSAPQMALRETGWSGWPMLAGIIAVAVVAAVLLAIGALID
jgi:hypothetical protein